MKAGIILGILVAIVVVISSSLYIVHEGEQALVVQFGRIIGKPVTEAGIHYKLPFVQKVRYFEKRILSWDGDDEQIPTKDKKYIIVDTTARWKIEDPVQFAKSLIDENGARAKLNGILDGITRDTISNHNLVEGVRNSNNILDKTEDEESEDDILGELEKVQLGRERLSSLIIDRAREELQPFGIKLIDVQLRRIAYEKSVEDKVYDRMISERNRIAERIRSIGKGEEAKILGRINRDLKEIQSGAYRESQEIRGNAEAEAFNIYAKSLSSYPDFYKFHRNLEAYRKTLTKGKDNRLILSTDMEFFRLLKNQ